MTTEKRPLPPAAEWNEEEKCWEIKISEYLEVRFQGHRLYVIGSSFHMRVYYDQITEERGIECFEEKYEKENWGEPGKDELPNYDGDLNDE